MGEDKIELNEALYKELKDKKQEDETLEDVLFRLTDVNPAISGTVYKLECSPRIRERMDKLLGYILSNKGYRLGFKQRQDNQSIVLKSVDEGIKILEIEVTLNKAEISIYDCGGSPIIIGYIEEKTPEEIEIKRVYGNTAESELDTISYLAKECNRGIDDELKLK